MAIHIEVYAHLNDRDVKREADKLGTAFDQAGIRASTQFTDAFSKGLAKDSPKIQKAFNAIENATEGADRAFRDYMKTMSSAKATQEQQIRATENLNRAKRAESDATRSATAAIQSETAAYLKQRQAIRESQNAINSINDSVQQLGTNAFKTARGIGAIAAIPVIGALFETAKVAVTASQSIALLPAAALAGAAGIGTLKLATSGFLEAMKEVGGDTDKFNEAIAKLAPSAQSAAYAVRNSLMPAIDSLRSATENEFFAGFDQRIDQLTKTFGPTIQTLTTSIAQSMNQATTGTADMLLTPTNQANITELTDNIAAAFQGAAPAVESFSQAFLDIAKVGSDFLPELGEGVSVVASEFATFIREARESGELKKWIQEGIDAVKALGDVLLDVAKTVYSIFGGAGQGEIQAWTDQMHSALTTVEVLIWPINEAFKLMHTSILDTGKSISDLISPIQIVTELVNSIRWFLDPNYRAAESATQGALDKLNEARARKGLPPVGPDGTPVSGAPGTGPGAPGGGAGGGLGARYPGLGTRIGDKGPIDMFGNPLYGDQPPKAGAGSDKDRRDAIIAGLDPALWQVDPFGGMAGMQMGPGANPQDVLEQQRNVIGEAHDLEEATKNRLALERDNTATAQDVHEAKWKELEETWQLQEAQVKLAEEMAGTAKDIKSGADELSAALDPDLGLGKGLAGLADNLVRFLGHLAAAPMMAKLQTGINANAAATGMQGGYGLLGMMGARNMAQGLSPLLGQPMPTGGTGTPPSGLGGILGAMGSPASTGGGYQSSYTPMGGQYPSATAAAGSLPSRPTGGYIGDAALLANVPTSGKYSQEPGRDLLKGLSDCSSSIGDLVNILDGVPTTSGENLWTGNASQWLPQHGFQQGMGGPGDFRVGFNSGHMQATLPGGTNWNWGGTESAARGGIGGTGAFDPAFTSHYFRPAGDGPAGPATVGSGPLGTPLPAAPTRSGGISGGYGITGGPGTSGGPGGLMPMLGTGVGGGMGMNPTLPTGVGGRNASPDQPGTRIGAAVEPPSTPGGGGGFGIEPGGTIDTAIGMAASAADLFAPGAGQAMQTGMKLASRAIQYGGQMAGIGVGGLMETFLPTGGSELANNSWLTKIAGGIASASPQLPNLAGKQTQEAQGALTPEQVAAAGGQHGMGQGQPPGPVNVQYNAYGQTEDRSGIDLAERLERVNAAPMFGMGGQR